MSDMAGDKNHNIILKNFRALSSRVKTTLIYATLLIFLAGIVAWALAAPTSSKHSESGYECQYSEQLEDANFHHKSNSVFKCGSVYNKASDGHKVINPSLYAEFREWIKESALDPIVWLTFVLAVSTILLWIATKALADDARVNTKLAIDAFNLNRQQYISSHRPRIRFRSAIPEAFEVGKPIVCKIVIANIGDTDATICAVGIDCGVRGIKPGEESALSAIYCDPSDFAKEVIPPGKQYSFFWTCKHIITNDEWFGIRLGWEQLCLAASIAYVDENGTGRTTGAFRIFRPDRGRFFSAPSDDEHADDEWEY